MNPGKLKRSGRKSVINVRTLARELVPCPIEQAAIAERTRPRKRDKTLMEVRDRMRPKAFLIPHHLVADFGRRANG